MSGRLRAVASGGAVVAIFGALLPITIAAAPIAAAPTAAHAAVPHAGATVTPPACPAATTGPTGLGPAEHIDLLPTAPARVFAMHHKTVLEDAATYGTIYASLDRELRAQVDPYRAGDRANIVVFNELNGLTYAVEGTRAQVARDHASTWTFVDNNGAGEGTTAIGSVAGFYATPAAYYTTVAGFPPPSGVAQGVERLFTAITDTLVRGVVENAACLARAHGVYVLIGTPLPVLEGAACTGSYAGWVACPGWHRSTDPADRCALGDPDLAGGPAPLTCLLPYVYRADTPNIDNVQLVFAPDGRLYDMQPKVNLTPVELGTLGWNQASASTIHAIPLFGADAVHFPQVQMGVGISLDAFETAASTPPCPAEVGGQAVSNPYPQFMQCLDSKGVTVFVQPEWNAAAASCMSWTDFAEGGDGPTSGTPCGPGWSWQPLSWMRSAWFSVQGRTGDGGFRFKNFRYAVNPFITGHLFDVAGDGQTAIFSRYDPRAGRGWYAGDSNASLYAAAGPFSDRPDDPRYAGFEGPQPGFLSMTSWAIPESGPGARYRVRTPALAPGDPGSLRSCEHGLAPGSGVTPAAAMAAFGTDACAEDNYHSTALVADIDPSLGEPSAPAGSLPNTSLPPAQPLVVLLLVAAVMMVRRRRRGA
jgi:predicted amidohydrolase